MSNSSSTRTTLPIFRFNSFTSSVTSFNNTPSTGLEVSSTSSGNTVSLVEILREERVVVELETGTTRRDDNSSLASVVIDSNLSRENRVEPMKDGEIGWCEISLRERGQNSEEAGSRSASELSSPISTQAVNTLSNLNNKKHSFTNPLNPATEKIFTFIFSLVVLIGTIILFIILANSHSGQFASLDNDNDNDNDTGSSSLGFNSTIPSPSSPFSNSTTSILNPTTLQGIKSTSNSITMIFILVALTLETIYFYTRLSALYAFFRTRRLSRESELGGAELELGDVSGESGNQEVGRGGEDAVTTQASRKPYSPTGFTKYFELFLSLPPPTLVPSLIPSLPLSSSSNGPVNLNRRRRSEPLSPEDQIISFAHQEGSAPFYGSEEMRFSELLLRSNSRSTLVNERRRSQREERAEGVRVEEGEV